MTLLQLAADQQELPQRRIDDRAAQVRIAAQEKAEHRRCHQQEREDREEPVIGQSGREIAALVV